MDTFLEAAASKSANEMTLSDTNSEGHKTATPPSDSSATHGAARESACARQTSPGADDTARLMESRTQSDGSHTTGLKSSDGDSAEPVSHDAGLGSKTSDDDDLSRLADLTEDTVLETVLQRYHNDDIYTRCGDVLISVNPCKALPIYGEKAHELYTPDALSRTPNPHPHIYWLASLAASRRTRENVDQVVLVSGESGSGKTVATKLTIKHILYLSQSRNRQGLYDSIDQVNPLVELFGNARTILNENSSRYAKFLELKFSQDGAVTGAVIRDYILEKSRVVSLAKGECNFHIFYTFLDDVMSDPERQKQFLMEGMDKCRHFRITPESSWSRNSNRMSAKEQARVFEAIGVPQEEIDNLHTILAAILHLTNIRFVDDDSSYGAVVVENEDTMNKAASLLSVNPEKLARVLVTTKTKFGREEIETFKSHGRAEGGRDAMAKALYERMFGWLIRRINKALNKTQSLGAAGIGVVDLCGFENLPQNSLEQLCINLANEHLQSFMNKQVFEHDMNLYKHEGIHLGTVMAPSNEEIMDMFNKPRVGLLSLMNEDTRLDIATDESMVKKMAARHAQSLPFLYEEGGHRFGIQHFAGPVWYDAKYFLEKNRDVVGADITEALVASSNELISDIFQVEKAPTGSISMTPFHYRVSKKHPVHFRQQNITKLSSSLVTGLKESLRERFGDKIPDLQESPVNQFCRQRTIIDCFQASMDELLKKMKTAQPFFVRCIKPNDQQQAGHFDEGKVRPQLRYNGVTEIARIRRFWFPVRIPQAQFLLRYGTLAPVSNTDKKTAAGMILEQMGMAPDDFRIGRTLVFLKDHVLRLLDQELRNRQEEERTAKEKAERERLRLEREKQNEERKKRRMDTETERREDALTPDSAEEEDQRKRNTHVQSQTPENESEDEESDEVSVKPTTISESGEIPDPDYLGRSAFTPFGMTAIPELPNCLTSLRGSVLSQSDRNSLASSASETSSSNTSSSSSSSSVSSRHSSASHEQKKASHAGQHVYWDIFRIVKREQTTRDLHNLRVMKVIKLMAYIVIFLIVLASATAQKVSLMLLVTAMETGDQATKEAYYILLLVAVCVPYALTFITSLFKVIFGAHWNPSVVTWLWVMAMESLHTFGLSLLVFRVLPRAYTAAHGLLLLSVAGVLPSILKPVTCVEVKSSGRQDKNKRHCVVILDILAFAGQLSVFPVVFTLHYIRSDGYDEVLDVIGAFTLMSCNQWENFTDGRLFVNLGEENRWKNFILKRRFELERGRYYPLMGISLWKILLTGVVSYFLWGYGHMDYAASFTRAFTDTDLISHTAVIALTVCAFMCERSSVLACKLGMQRFSFALPLLLSTATAFGLFLWQWTRARLHEFCSIKDTQTSNLASDWRILVTGIVWWVALLLLTRHVWFPRQSRLAKREKLFATPHHCGVLTMESLLLNRRRHTLPIQEKEGFRKVFYKLASAELGQKGTESAYSVRRDSVAYSTLSDMNSFDRPRQNGDDHHVPMVYACATMWHENRREMEALLKSLHRLDFDQWMRSQAQEIAGVKDKDFFRFESHIFFDDAMTLNDADQCIPNDYVNMLVDVMEEAVNAVHKKAMTVKPPLKIPTPYGGQLVWMMPGGNLLFVHLKDKAKIRHRKRWSQVMYMYYLLGFRLTRQCQEKIVQVLKEWGDKPAKETDVFHMFDDNLTLKSRNTFILALDGDTDFSPGSVHILLDRMKKNHKVGAACGRIHPMGSGPMVWYQMFEYAIGHWMQKATEHVLGCVLCSPGCFSLFRGSALMDDNMMRKYAITSTEPGDYLQYDQGEDRWLSTLLLQQGYRIEYAAAADAWTYVPESFNEFFNQRRRWTPSTLANLLDLLSDYSNVIAENSNISFLYIVYQVALLIATIIGPGTVLMMIAGAVGVVFSVNLWWSYVIAVLPAVLFLIICLKFSAGVQLFFAAFFSTFYAFVMMVVFVGTIVKAVQDSIFDPSVMVVIALILFLTVAALFHPLELYCLPSGILYLLCIPSGYLLLVIYSLCNINVVSWGTREAVKRTNQRQDNEGGKDKKPKGLLSRLFMSSFVSEMKEVLGSLSGKGQGSRVKVDERSLKLLQELTDSLRKLTAKGENSSDAEMTSLPALSGKGENSPDTEGPSLADPAEVRVEHGDRLKSVNEDVTEDRKKERVRIAEPNTKKSRDDGGKPAWSECRGLGSGGVSELNEEEREFWDTFLDRYMKPLDTDKNTEEDIATGLKLLRNQAVFVVSTVNLLWMAVNFLFQLTTPVTVYIDVRDDHVPVGLLGLLFLMLIACILLLQLIGMLFHRLGTFMHLLAFTDLACLPCLRAEVTRRDIRQRELQTVLDFCQHMYEEPLPDYWETEDEDSQQTVEAIARTIKDSILGRPSYQRGTQAANVRQALGVSFATSRAVNLYLRATQNPNDREARDFLGEFRENIGNSRRPLDNSRHQFGFSRLDIGNDRNDVRHSAGLATFTGNGISGRHGVSFGQFPSQPSHAFQPPHSSNQHIRRRNANHLRHTVKDAIERAQREAGVSIEPARNDFGGETVNIGRSIGAMDRAFSRRIEMFSRYRAGPGRRFESDVHVV